jgi:hypothetical protein
VGADHLYFDVLDPRSSCALRSMLQLPQCRSIKSRLLSVSCCPVVEATVLAMVGFGIDTQDSVQHSDNYKEESKISTSNPLNEDDEQDIVPHRRRWKDTHPDSDLPVL